MPLPAYGASSDTTSWSSSSRSSHWQPNASRIASSYPYQARRPVPDRPRAPYPDNYIDLTGESDGEEGPGARREAGTQQRLIPDRPVPTVPTANNGSRTPSSSWDPIFPGASNLGPIDLDPDYRSAEPYGSSFGPSGPSGSVSSGYSTPGQASGPSRTQCFQGAENYLNSGNPLSYNTEWDPFRQSGPANNSSSVDPFFGFDPADFLDLLRPLSPDENHSPYPYLPHVSSSSHLSSALGMLRDTFRQEHEQGHLTSREVTENHSPYPYLPRVSSSSQLGSAIGKLRDKFQQGHEQGKLTSQDVTNEITNLLRNIRPDQELDMNREGTPDAMKYALMEHQKLGLAWMKSMEEGTNKGGILADDMGLGKTIQALALMISRPSTDPENKTTLIVAPVALLQQWKREIERKLKSDGHQLSVFILHGEKRSTPFRRLKQYDVVLTTFGTLASELKQKDKWDKMREEDPELFERAAPIDVLSILGNHCKWYRVILDEAQCIKNRNTKTARACCAIRSTYRWCMSGTPMMNNVTELYSLVKFLRIGPYNNLETFNSTFGRPLKREDSAAFHQAMRKLQALLKAILLRRTKTSEIDGKPILQLPPRTTEKVHAVFSDDEAEFYRALENRTQLQFNKYLKAGTVGKNYSNVLVLLLRLRQACCHPHLIKDFAVNLNPASDGVDMVANAKLFDPAVVARLTENENLECPVCIDAMENGIIFYPCGHSTCAECFARISDPSAALALGSDRGTVEIKCPNCRGQVDPKKITDSASFRKAFGIGEAGIAGNDNGETPEEFDDDDSDSDGLSKFIVNDDDEDIAADNRDSTQIATTQSKGKEKAPGNPGKSLAALKKAADRNVKAKKKYLRQLEKAWEPSAKSTKAMEVLSQIQNGSEDEKTIVFSQFTSMLDLLEVPIRRAGWRYRRYDGSMKPAERNEAVLEFSDDPNCRIMLVSLKAGNSGLNLAAASQVIIFDPFWNPYIEEQAVDRAHRIGQLRPVTVHRVLVQKTVEDRILSLQDKKRELIEGALDEKASGNISRLGTQELAFLFGVSPAGRAR